MPQLIVFGIVVYLLYLLVVKIIIPFIVNVVIPSATVIGCIVIGAGVVFGLLCSLWSFVKALRHIGERTFK